MKVITRRVSVAALALVVCLSISPIAAAAQRDQPLLQFREKISWLLKKLKTFGGIVAFEDNPGPPKPTP
jgi:hypothetical protein